MAAESKFLVGGLYHEHLENGQQRVFTVDEVLVQRTTELGQFLEIVALRGYGKTLFLDGVRQSSEADEHIYHEMLVHPAMFAVPAPRRVLVAGGGEGAAAREVLRHRSVERAVQVDLDPEVVALCRRHLPEWGAGAYEDPRLELIHDDVLRYLEQHDEPFDVIVLDVPEWIENTPLEQLYAPEFYRLVKSRLAPGGAVIGQIGPVHPTRSDAFLPFARARTKAFAHVRFTVVPELGWIFGLASESPLSVHYDPARLASPLRYYSPELCDGYSVLPPHLRDAI